MSPSHTTVRLLGRVTVTVDGHEAEPPPRTHGLLAIVALTPEGLDRAELAALVAPDRAEEAARRRLSRLLWLLRDTHPELPLETSPRRVRLALGPSHVDATAVEELVARSTASADESALASLTGPLCPQSDLPWVKRRRARLDELATRVGIRVAEARTARGEHHGAWDAANWVLDHAPTSARALELRLGADLALGRHGDGLAAFEHWCHWRGIGEGDAPGAIREMVVALRDPGASPAPEPPAGAPPPAWLAYARLAGARGDTAAHRRALERLRSAVTSGHLERSALRLVEVDAALDHHDLALADRLLEMGAADPDTVPLRARRCRAALAHGRFERAAEEASAALLGGYVSEHEEDRLEALLAFASTRARESESRDALAAAGQARDAARHLGMLDRELAAEVIAGGEEIRRGRCAAAAARLTRARQRAAGAGLERLEGQALHELGRARCRLGEFGTADALQRDELALWQRLGLPAQEAAACNERAYTLVCSGRHRAAVELLDRALALSEQCPTPAAAGWTLTFRALALACREGASASSFEAVEQAEVAAQRADHPGLSAAVALLRGFLRYLCSDPAAALADVVRAREHYAAAGELGRMPVVLAVEALVRLQAGEVSAAMDASTQALTTVAQQGANEFALPVHYAHARALEAVGRGEEARLWLARGAERLKEFAAKGEMGEAPLATRDPLTRALVAQAAASGTPERDASGRQEDATDPAPLISPGS